MFQCDLYVLVNQQNKYQINRKVIFKGCQDELGKIAVVEKNPLRRKGSQFFFSIKFSSPLLFVCVYVYDDNKLNMQTNVQIDSGTAHHIKHRDHITIEVSILLLTQHTILFLYISLTFLWPLVHFCLLLLLFFGLHC